MATYNELATIQSDPGWQSLQQKIETATAIKAQSVIDAPAPPAARLDWARESIASVRSAANDLRFYVVAANNTATIAQIIGATDAQVQTNIDAAVDALYP